jgi:hypothetical protein
MAGSHLILDMQVLYTMNLLLGESIYFQRSQPYFICTASLHARVYLQQMSWYQPHIAQVHVQRD